MTVRPTPDPEIVPLVRAIKARIEGLGPLDVTPKDGVDVYSRDHMAFLQLELKRDHMSLDLWLPADKIEEARASGIARAHPFLGDEAVKIRFERAEDLSRVARWIEASYEYAPTRSLQPPRDPSEPIERDTPLIKSLPPSASRPPAPALSESPSSVPALASVAPGLEPKAAPKPILNTRPPTPTKGSKARPAVLPAAKGRAKAKVAKKKASAAKAKPAKGSKKAVARVAKAKKTTKKISPSKAKAKKR